MAEQTKTKLQRDDNTFILRDAFYPTVEKNLANKSQVKEFIKYVVEYRNRNLDQLTRVYPSKVIFFDRNGEDAKIVFRTCGVAEKEITPVIKQAKSAVLLDQMKADALMEFCVMLIMMMKYFYKDKETLKYCAMYYSYAIWHLVYKKYYSKFIPPEEVVDFTINELDNKYDMKRLGSLDAALEKMMDAVIIWAEDRLERLSDKDIIDIIQSIRTRLNNINKTVGNRIHANNKAGNRIFKSVETDSETGEIIADRENSSGMTANLAAEYTTKFFSNGVSSSAVNIAAKMCEISEKELRTAIELLLTENNVREVKLFYECLFYAFFQYYPSAKASDVRTAKFLAAANSIYKKGNSLDKNVVTIKDLSHKWLEKGSRVYKVSNRAATQNSFRKAIFLYFALVCAQSN